MVPLSVAYHLSRLSSHLSDSQNVIYANLVAPTERKPALQARCSIEDGASPCPTSLPSPPPSGSVHPSRGHGERARIDRDTLGAVVGLVDAHEPIGHCARGKREHR